MEAVSNVGTRKPGAFEKRIHEVDFLRGACIVLVLFDHLLWNFSHYFPIWGQKVGSAFLNNVGAFANWYWNWPVRSMVQFVVLCMFVFLSGISCAFSKDNWKRAGLMVILWFLLLIGSNILNGFSSQPNPGQSFVLNFNVIGVIAFSVLFYCLFQKASWKLLAANVLFLFILYKAVIPTLFYHTGGNSSLPFPLWSEWTYRATIGTNFYNPSWGSDVGTVLVNGKQYINADFMSLFPYIIPFFIGAIVGKVFYKERKSLISKRKEFERPICFMGRHSLLFYIGSQIFYMAIFGLINLFFK